jgi:hypothetical protein
MASAHRQADFTPYEGKSVTGVILDADAAAAQNHDADLALALQMQEVRSGYIKSGPGVRLSLGLGSQLGDPDIEQGADLVGSPSLAQPGTSEFGPGSIQTIWGIMHDH